MKLAKVWILANILVFCLILMPHKIFAQDAGNVLINTDPQGALVRLNGELNMSGVTPVRFDRVLSGRYQMDIIRDGYENFSAVNYFSEAQVSQLDIELVPKTRTKAFFRSLIFPGWGQRYYGNNTKATFFTLGTVASLVTYVFVKDDYDSKVDDYNDRKAAFNDANQWSELPRLQSALYDAQKRADDAEEIVNIVTAVTVGIYALNLLDSFLLFPDFDRYTEYKAITAAPEVESNRVALKLSVNF